MIVAPPKRLSIWFAAIIVSHIALPMSALPLSALSMSSANAENFDRAVDDITVHKVEQNNLEALFEKAEAGDPAAQYALGKSYLAGLKVAQNDELGMRWLHRSADKGHVDAQYALGQMLMLGHRIRQDLIHAYMWFSLAAAKGHQRAIHFQHITATKMNRLQIDEAQWLAHVWRPEPAGYEEYPARY